MSNHKGENNFLDTYVGRVIDMSYPGADWHPESGRCIELQTVRAFNHKEAEEQVRAEVLKNRDAYPEDYEITIKRYKHKRVVSTPADQYRTKEKEKREARIAQAKARKRGGKR